MISMSIAIEDKASKFFEAVGEYMEERGPDVATLPELPEVLVETKSAQRANLCRFVMYPSRDFVLWFAKIVTDAAS